MTWKPPSTVWLVSSDGCEPSNRNVLPLGPCTSRDEAAAAWRRWRANSDPSTDEAWKPEFHLYGRWDLIDGLEGVIAELRHQNARLKEKVEAWADAFGEAVEAKNVAEALCLKLNRRLEWWAHYPVTEPPPMMPMIEWGRSEPEKLTPEELDALKAMEEKCPP